MPSATCDRRSGNRCATGPGTTGPVSQEHSAVVVAPSAEILPRGHGVHAVLPRAAENVSTAQSVQGLTPLTPNEPGSHHTIASE